MLRRLVEATGETASFYVREKNVRVCLFRQNSPHAARHHLDEGAQLPLTAGASAHVLLAFFLFVPPGNLDARVRTAGIMLFVDNVMCWFKGYSWVPFTPHLWTLSYEMQIYPFIPLLAIVGIRNPRALLWVLAALLVTAVFARGALSALGVQHPVIWVTPILRPESVVAGVAMVLLVNQGILKHPYAPNLIGTVTILTLAVFSLLPMPLAGFGSMLTYLIVGTLSGCAIALPFALSRLVNIFGGRSDAFWM